MKMYRKAFTVVVMVPILIMLTTTPAHALFGSILAGIQRAQIKRNLFSATSSIFQMTARALATFLNLREASVRSRRAEKGDSTGLVVRRCCHCCLG